MVLTHIVRGQREPFTVADVHWQRAKEEMEVRTQKGVTVGMVRWEGLNPCWLSSAQMPEIVVYPCDNTPLRYAELVYPDAATFSKHVDANIGFDFSSTMFKVSNLPHALSIESDLVGGALKKTPRCRCCRQQLAMRKSRRSRSA